MRKKARFFLPFLAVFFALVSTSGLSSAFWIWTPKEDEIVNPKFAPKDTPEEQFKSAKSLFDEKEFKRAAGEFVQLVDHYKESDLAPEAQYYAARAYEELGKYQAAFENYQKTVDKYPYTGRLEEIIKREYDIANIFQTKDAPKLGDIELNLALDRAVEIYKKIIENSSFGEYADKSLYNMAECYKRMKKYGEAIDAYSKIVTDYPSSPLAPDAKYQLAYTTYEASLDPDYDQESTEKALKSFEKISADTAVPEIASEAEKAIDLLRSRKAESLLNVARFYEKQNKLKSALVYYKDVLRQFPDTPAARGASESVKAIEKGAAK